MEESVEIDKEGLENIKAKKAKDILHAIKFFKQSVSWNYGNLQKA